MNKPSLVVLPFKGPSGAQVLPLAQLHHWLAFFSRMMELFFRIAHEQAVAGGPSFQEPKCCSSASVGPAAPFVGTLFPNDGIVFPNGP